MKTKKFVLSGPAVIALKEFVRLKARLGDWIAPKDLTRPAIGSSVRAVLLADLVKAGYLERKPIRPSGRQFNYSITAKGQKVVHDSDKG